MPTKPKAPDTPGKARPSEPAIPKARPSELALAKPKNEPANPKPRPSEVALPKVLELALPKAEPAKLPKSKSGDPAKEVPKPAEKGIPAEWKAFLAKPLTCTWRRSAGHLIEVIDWAKFPGREAWLGDVFGDCDFPKHFTGLVADVGGQIKWISTTMLPVALLGQQHGGEGQLEAILLIELAVADSPIYAIEVDGTAIPAKKPQQVAANLAALGIQVVKPDARPKKGVDFTKRSLIASGNMNAEARKIMAALTGDKDGGASYLMPHVAKKPKPPEHRDPQWIDALRDELAKSMVFASTGYQSETYMFAGALASFGQPAIPALVAAFETALKSYPKQSLAYGVKPVLDAFDYLASDAGVPLALAIVERASKPEQSWAIPPVLDYLKGRSDARIAPEIKKLYKRVASKKPMHYLAELQALATLLGVA